MTRWVRTPTICPLSPAFVVGLASVQASVLVLCIDPRWALLPFALFVVVTAVAPFLFRWSYFLPVISRGATDRKRVALTFDGGPDPATHGELLRLLRRHRLAGTFFVVGQRVLAHPELIQAALAEGHTFGNHTQTHDRCLPFRGTARIRSEVAGCQAALATCGLRPRLFRPVAGITWWRLFRPLVEEGLECVTYTVRARDAGDRRITGVAERVLSRIRPGAIVLLHDGRPGASLRVSEWLAEVEHVILGLIARGYAIVPLEELLQRPIMEDANAPARSPAPVRRFYDGLARSYDREQTSPSSALARGAECGIFEQDVLPRISREHVVLELGAGTGRFTLPLARRARAVVAIDAAPRMLELLELKARGEGLANIETRVSDFRCYEPSARFDVMCAFSCLEYEPDLSALLQRYSAFLKPGGIVVLTMARRGLVRFFIQVGNAMRQGLWLRARSRRDILAAAGRARLEVLRITALASVFPFSAGLLWYVLLRSHPTDQGDTTLGRGVPTE